MKPLKLQKAFSDLLPMFNEPFKFIDAEDMKFTAEMRKSVILEIPRAACMDG